MDLKSGKMSKCHPFFFLFYGSHELIICILLKCVYFGGHMCTTVQVFAVQHCYKCCGDLAMDHTSVGLLQSWIFFSFFFHEKSPFVVSKAWVNSALPLGCSQSELTRAIVADFKTRLLYAAQWHVPTYINSTMHPV